MVKFGQLFRYRCTVLSSDFRTYKKHVTSEIANFDPPLLPHNNTYSWIFCMRMGAYAPLIPNASDIRLACPLSSKCILTYNYRCDHCKNFHRVSFKMSTIKSRFEGSDAYKNECTYFVHYTVRKRTLCLDLCSGCHGDHWSWERGHYEYWRVQSSSVVCLAISVKRLLNCHLSHFVTWENCVITISLKQITFHWHEDGSNHTRNTHAFIPTLRIDRHIILAWIFENHAIFEFSIPNTWKYWWIIRCQTKCISSLYIIMCYI